jgi:hypothetical protein
MSSRRTILISAVAAGATAAGLAVASGGPPPQDPHAPEPDTVVAHGRAQSRVAEPPKRTNGSVERAVVDARMRSIPKAVDAARTEAAALAKAAGLELGEPAGIARDAPAPGWYDDSTGRFGPGRWCGNIVTWHSKRGADGTPRRFSRSHRGCHKPKRVEVSVTVTFAATR